MILETIYRSTRKGEKLTIVRIQRELEDAGADTALDKSGEFYSLTVRQGRHRKASEKEEQPGLPLQPFENNITK